MFGNIIRTSIPDYLLGTEGTFLGPPVLKGLHVPLQQNN
jgi:hypothetical protein